MELVLGAYLVIGLLHANGKINNSNPAHRPVWASDMSVPFLMRVVGFVLIALVWPISLILNKRG